MGDIYWRDYKGSISADAVPTQHDTYIVQVILKNGGNVPGTLYPSEQVAFSEDETGRVIFKTNIKYLCSSKPKNFEWVSVNTSSLDEGYLHNCVPGGFEIGRTLYIGKIFHQNEWKIGKVFPKIETKYPGLRV
nr:uncharacterized protein LOC111416602 [Onthophagus taurus]